jgi:putative ABC transport system permease protein
MINVVMAARNLSRNRRRAMIALFTVAIGGVSLLLANGFIQWVLWAMRESTIPQLGHVQVMRPGYLSAGAVDPYAYVLPGDLPQRDIIESTPGVKFVAPRLMASGLIGHGETTIAFLASGIDPKKEAELSKALRIVEGRYLDNSTAKEVVLGRGLARSLNVRPGATVALLVPTRGGGINAIEAKVAGVFVSTNQAYDDSALHLPIGVAQSLMRVHGAHVWLVLLDETERTDHYLEQFRARFPPTANNLQFVPWYQQADFYNKTVALFSQQMNVLRLIIGCIIVLSISNMLVMNVLERTGEIGTLLAIGLKRNKILRLFAVEGLLLGLAGASLGLGVGYGLAELISAIGIPMPPPPGMEEGYTGQIRITFSVMMNAFLITFITTFLAGLYPAWKASRLEIIDALRHNI